MPKKCDKRNCVSKKRYDDLLVENKALREKIKALEMGKLPVRKFQSSDPIDSGSSGFDTPNSQEPDSDFESVVSPVFSPMAAKSKKKSGKKKKSKGKSRSRGKTVKRVKG